jgi:hypothetical protein
MNGTGARLPQPDAGARPAMNAAEHPEPLRLGNRRRQEPFECKGCEAVGAIREVVLV